MKYALFSLSLIGAASLVACGKSEPPAPAAPAAAPAAAAAPASTKARRADHTGSSRAVVVEVETVADEADWRSQMKHIGE